MSTGSNTSGYTQEQIDAEVSNLQAAINGLQLLPDASHLESLVVEAEQITDVGYTAPTWSSFTANRTSSRALLNGLDYTTPQVDTSYNNLSVSMTSLSLVSVPVTPPVKPSRDYSMLITGNILPYIDHSYGIFAANVMLVRPLLIGIFAIIMAIRVIPLIFKKIFR